MFKWTSYTLQHSGKRGLETWRNIACNILRSVFQWRWLHAAALSTSRTGKRMQHCLQYSAQRVSVEMATCCSIKYIEDWKKDATLPAILRTTCFSGGGYTLHHYEQRELETWFQHCLFSGYGFVRRCFSGGCNMLQHYVQ